MLDTVQPAEPARRPRTDYRGRGAPEKLSPDTVGKPPEPKITVISYPDLLSRTPEEQYRLLADGSIRVRIHPDQFGELVREVGVESSLLEGKFIVDPNTGRRVDTLA